MKTHSFLALLLVFGCTAAHAGAAVESERIVRQALSKFDNDYKSSWAYTRIARKNGKSNSVTVGHFDPSQAPAKQWSLTSLGGRPPTVKEHKAWVLRRAKEDEGNKNGIEKIITPGSVQLLEDNETHWRFGFTPAADQFHDTKTRTLLAHVSGQLLVKKLGLHVVEVLLSSDQPFRPATGIKINIFEMRMTYGPISQDSPVLPLGVYSHIQGRAFFAVSFDDIKKVRFSNYMKVVDANNQQHTR